MASANRNRRFRLPAGVAKGGDWRGRIGDVGLGIASQISATAFVGRVDYVYEIGRHEITVEQYVKFLNAVDRLGGDMQQLWFPLMDPVAGGRNYWRYPTRIDDAPTPEPPYARASHPNGMHELGIVLRRK